MERALDTLLTAGGESIEQLAISDEAERGARLRAIIKFQDSQLNVRLLMRLSHGHPIVAEYSFHYMTADAATIFRYDSSVHHPGLPHFPHHKHQGADERIIGCPQPTVRAIRNEIAAYLRND